MNNSTHTKSFMRRRIQSTYIALGKAIGLSTFPRRSGYHYVPDYYGRAAKKGVDLRRRPIFGTLAGKTIADGRTLLSYDRLYIIYQALENLSRIYDPHIPLKMVEVGVYRGGTSYFIASVAQALGFEQARLYACDTFEGHAKQDPQEGIDRISIHKPGLFSDTQVEAVQDYLSVFPKAQVKKGRFQDTAPQIEDEVFHFVHLDVDLYEPILFALNFFDHRLADGGVIIVDDYEVSSCPGVKQAVDVFCAAHPDYFALHPLTEQCVLVKRNIASSRLDK